MLCGLLHHIWLLGSTCQQQSRNTVAMQDNIIVHFYILSVCDPPTTCPGAKHTTVKEELADTESRNFR